MEEDDGFPSPVRWRTPAGGMRRAEDAGKRKPRPLRLRARGPCKTAYDRRKGFRAQSGLASCARG